MDETILQRLAQGNHLRRRLSSSNPPSPRVDPQRAERRLIRRRLLTAFSFPWVSGVGFPLMKDFAKGIVDATFKTFRHTACFLQRYIVVLSFDFILEGLEEGRCSVFIVGQAMLTPKLYKLKNPKSLSAMVKRSAYLRLGMDMGRGMLDNHRLDF